MELFPTLSLGLLNGWLLLLLFYIVYGVLLFIFPKEVRDRLYDRTGWSQKHRRIALISAPFAFLALILVTLTPLKIGSPVFIVGISLYAIGMVDFVKALFDFKAAPQDQPATNGFYRISRNPQWISFALIMVSTAIAVGSWAALLLFAVRIIATHYRILAEEESCLERYGDSYRNYMRQVPRYLLIV